MSAQSDKDAIVAVLRDQAAPVRGWTASTLCKAAGLGRDEFHAAIRSLRYAGKIDFEDYALSPSMAAVRDEQPQNAATKPDDSIANPDFVAAIKAEATQAVARRAAARSTGTVVRKGHVELTAGGLVQDIALHDDPGTAVAVLQGRWPELWAGVRASALAHGERPVTSLLRLIGTALEMEGSQA